MTQRIGWASLRWLGPTITGLILFLAGPAAAAPALWLAQGPNAAVYLFGTVHVLKPGMVWQTPPITKALAASQELWLEIPDPGDAQEAQTLTRQLGLDPQHPLSAKLPPAVLAHLQAIASAAGLPQGEKALEPMRPWLAAVSLEEAAVVHAGFDPRSGVEPQLLQQALAAGKPVHGFETMAQQLHFFADLAPSVELQLLEDALQEYDKGTEELNALVDAWLAGDEAAIARATIDELKGPFPALYQTIFVQRNQAWAAAIARMLQGSGTRFVAVGAGHLAGPDSVQAALQRLGITVTRVDTEK